MKIEHFLKVFGIYKISLKARELFHLQNCEKIYVYCIYNDSVSAMARKIVFGKKCLGKYSKWHNGFRLAQL